MTRGTKYMKNSINRSKDTDTGNVEDGRNICPCEMRVQRCFQGLVSQEIMCADESKDISLRQCKPITGVGVLTDADAATKQDA